MNVLALDIGGANLKAAHGQVRGEGDVIDAQAATLPFALWKQPDALGEKLKELAALFPPLDAIAVTMTAELCDCFEGRKSGVHHVLDAVADFAGERRVGVWLTKGHFTAVQEARVSWLACASANWHAQATWVARLYPLQRSLLIDVGSTTTDICILSEGQPQCLGETDLVRMNFGELLYTGVRRTPLMSLSPVEHISQMPGDPPEQLMAEHFATMQDVYVLLGDLSEDPSNTDTADGRPLTREATQRRVLRMIGADLETYAALMPARHAPLIAALELAAAMAQGLSDACARKQGQLIAASIKHVQESFRQMRPDAPFLRFDQVIVSGSGAFLAERAARVALPGWPVVKLDDHIGAKASSAACAWALLHLWNDEHLHAKAQG